MIKKSLFPRNKGEPLVLEEKLSIPGLAFQNIARRLEGQDIPFLDFMAAHNSLLSRIRRRFLGT
jgi:septum site-determining protein MinD